MRHQQPVCNDYVDLYDSSGTQNQPMPLMLEDLKQNYKYIAFCQDGANEQVKALENHLVDYGDNHDLDLVWVKYAGGASLTQSRNDVGKFHQIMHNTLSHSKYKYESVTRPPGRAWLELENILRHYLDPMSFATVWKAMCHSPVLLNNAFSTKNIISSGVKSGVCPLNERTILEACPHTKHFSDNDLDWLVNTACAQLANAVEDCDMVSELTFDEILSPRNGLDNCPPKYSGKSLNTMGVGRQRALIYGQNFRNGRAMLKADEESRLLNIKLWRPDDRDKAKELIDLQKAYERDMGIGSHCSTRKRVVVVKCANPACALFKNDANAKTIWEKCGVGFGDGRSKCRVTFCDAQACRELLMSHRRVCQKNSASAREQGEELN